MHLLRLILLMISGGILTWACGYGIELIAGDEISTSLQFRFFGGITLSFAVGGGVYLKDPNVGFSSNHNYYIALFAIPGALFASPLFLFSPEFAGLSVIAITWGVLAGACGYLLSKMLNFSNS